MAKSFASEELSIIADALASYNGEVKKLFNKAEKLGLPEAESIKEKFLTVESIRSKIEDQ